MEFLEDPQWIGRYWLLASPVGFGLSVWLGGRIAWGGQIDREKSIQVDPALARICRGGCAW